jgi:hypothetical protein
MTETQTPGRSAGSKPINLSQLQGEIETAGVAVTPGLGMLSIDGSTYVHMYDADGAPSDFPSADQAAVDAAIAAHVALRNKTSEEYATEFQAAGTTAARKQEIRDIQNGLMPPEQVPITQEEWDKRMNPAGVA